MNLKSCPFCGGNATLREIPPHTHHIVDFPAHNGSWVIECTKCDTGRINDSKEKLIEAWNTRVSSWILLSEKLPDCMSLQYIGSPRQATDSPRSGSQEYVVLAKGVMHCDCIKWQPIEMLPIDATVNKV